MKQLLLILIFSVVLVANVGKITALKGEVYLKRADALSVASKGQILEEKDTIQTSKRSKVQIVFNDDTVITLGQNSEFKISQFLFDEKNQKIELSASKGFFKAITGKIGKIAPKNFKLKIRTATIGIRGTHFLGLIEDDKETIGCTSGAISVTSNGEMVDVFAGEMITVVSGIIPKTPVRLDIKKIQSKSNSPVVSAIKNKISTIRLKQGSIQFNKKEILAVLADIKQIKENVIRRGLEDELNDKLNAAFKAGLFEKFNKIDASSKYLTNFTGDRTNYTPLTWGFVTFNKSQDKPENLYEYVTNLVPIQTYYELENKEVPIATDKSIISGFMGGADKPHWDGSGGDRKLMKFSGGAIAVSDTNTFSQTPNFPEDYDLKKFSAIKPNATNKIDMTVDFGNRTWYAKMVLDIDDKSYTVLFDSIGENSVNTSGINKYGIYEVNGKTSLLDAYYWRYYGDNIEQLGGNFNIIRDDGSAMVGSMILNQTSSVSLSAKTVATNANYEWGYWAQNDFATLSDSDILAQNPRGAWIKPASYDITPTEYFATATNATYNGAVHGTVNDPFVNETVLMSNGAVDMTFDFSNKKMSGNISFDSGSKKWQTSITDATVATSGFSFDQTNIQNSLLANEIVILTEGSGKFYGESAEQINGGFEMLSSSGKVAIGAFSATK